MQFSLRKQSTRTLSYDTLIQTSRSISPSMGVWLGLSMSKLSQKGAGRPPSVGGGLTLLQSLQSRTALVQQAHHMQQACHMAHKAALRVRSCMQREVGPAWGRASSSTSAPSASAAVRQRFGASSSCISAHSGLNPFLGQRKTRRHQKAFCALLAPHAWASASGGHTALHADGWCCRPCAAQARRRAHALLC